jgi:hypothetical protein
VNAGGEIPAHSKFPPVGVSSPQDNQMETPEVSLQVMTEEDPDVDSHVKRYPDLYSSGSSDEK